MTMNLRSATQADVKELLEIEAKCWSEELRTEREIIESRIARYPEGQFVVEHNGKVKGVLYTQRIKATADLVNGKYSSQFQLHNATGNTVQFLAIAVDKSLKGAGVFLRDSALKVLNGDETVIDVVAMSRCSGFKKSSNGKNQFAAYEKHVLGLKDPTIHFHVSGGAEVVQMLLSAPPGGSSN